MKRIFIYVPTIFLLVAATFFCTRPATGTSGEEKLLAISTFGAAYVFDEPIEEVHILEYTATEPELSTTMSVQAEAFVEEEIEYLASSSGYSTEYLRGCTPEQRRIIESSNTYDIYTGNGYVGAYQFSEQYLADRLMNSGVGAAYGVGTTEEFLNNPAAQDALADWYANDRYGGWENVPSSGGW